MNPVDADAARCAARIRIVVSLLSRRLRAGMRREGISAAKLSVLGQLHRSAAMTPTELAAGEGVKLQSLTRLLAELESEAWLVRKPHGSDGRQSLLTLTRQGAKRLTTSVQAGEASLAAVIAATLDADERALLLRACTLLDGIGAALGGEAADAESA